MYEFLDWQVRDVMSKPVTTSPGATLAEVEGVLEHHGFDGVPVVDDEGHLLGLATSLDLLAAFGFSEDSTLPAYVEIMQRPISRVMSKDVRTVCPRTPLTRVLEKVVDTRTRSFPVVDDDRVVGVVSRADVMSALRRAGLGEVPSP